MTAVFLISSLRASSSGRCAFCDRRGFRPVLKPGCVGGTLVLDCLTLRDIRTPWKKLSPFVGYFLFFFFFFGNGGFVRTEMLFPRLAALRVPSAGGLSLC